MIGGKRYRCYFHADGDENMVSSCTARRRGIYIRARDVVGRAEVPEGGCLARGRTVGLYIRPTKEAIRSLWEKGTMGPGVRRYETSVSREHPNAVNDSRPLIALRSAAKTRQTCHRDMQYAA